MFATRADLLARCNARRLFQRAVPTDAQMPADDGLLRLAIGGGDLSGLSPDEREAVDLALAAIDRALAAADARMLSYGLPAAARSPEIERLATTLAWFNLGGMEGMGEEETRSYNDALKSLQDHARGVINLAPGAAADPADDDGAYIVSGATRYGAGVVDSFEEF